MLDNFDFIVVGGGAAGSVIASGLARSAKHPTVLLIESGGKGLDSTNLQPYNRYMNAFTLPDVNNGYETVPQKGLGGKRLPYLSGKGLGGSTLINFMIYTRAPSTDWDRWASLVDDEDWSWSKMLQRYKMIENFHGAISPDLSKYVKPELVKHGYHGPLDVSLPGNNAEGFVKTTLEAGLQAGLPLNLDVNSGDVMGVAISNISMGDGKRSTAATAFLKDLPDNLTIWTDSHVAKVIIEESTVIGVQLVDGKIAHASKEVILSAGSVNSPKLLLLSGIGPSDELKSLGIDVVHDLPGVGKNALDSLMVIVCDMMGPEFCTRSEFDADVLAHPAALQMWTESTTGPLTDNNKDSVIMFGKDPEIEKGLGFKDLDEERKKYLTNPAVPNWEVVAGGPLVPPAFAIPRDRNYTSHVAYAMNAQSTDPNYLDNPYDLEAFTAAIRFERKLMATEIMQRHYKEPICAPTSDSDEDIQAFIQATAGPLWRISTTAKMGRQSDKSAVTDSNFKVFGIKNLRVADMSVCPFNPCAHTQAPAYAIGQTAVDKLVSEYSLNG